MGTNDYRWYTFDLPDFQAIRCGPRIMAAFIIPFVNSKYMDSNRMDEESVYMLENEVSFKETMSGFGALLIKRHG